MAKQIQEIRGMDSRELRAKLSDLRKEQFNLRFHGAAEEVAKTARHRQIRTHIAQILTVLGERKEDEAQPAAAKSVAGANKS